MQFLECVRLLKLKVNPEQAFACLFLEAKGQRFLVDFGYENAIEKAADIPFNDMPHPERY